ncbi:uncharacterized protein LOC107047903 isoform X2 [Diachasma alloeum]|uniref:uncharacterized protein LOC107047903 isoform X2 n=1 Tax=Diachasma alloeum TaxID=454923 RepID=UPI0007383869|nr:uncharacterized protein LOC107047903 isoform X2 [Diachasma alloeum]
METFPAPRFETKIETFEPCIVAPANHRQITPNVVEQAAIIHIEDNHGNDEQADGQNEGDSHIQVSELQSNIQQNMTLTPVRLPAILDGEYFSVIRIDDSNVTVRCLQCQKLLNGNLKSTGNFLSHIKRVHPILIEKIKTKSHQRKPAVAYIDTTAEKSEVPKTKKGYRKCYRTYSQDESPSNADDNCEQSSTNWPETPPIIKKRRTDEPEHQEVARPSQVNTYGVEDEFDAIGRNVAAKLRNMRLDQRIVAEKLLNDVLFEAQLGTLHREAALHV